MGKNTLSLCIVSLLLAYLSGASCAWSISKDSSTIIVPDQYSTIQEATDNKQSVRNELDFTRNLVYVFIGATAVLIVTTIYVATKKPKTKPET